MAAVTAAVAAVPAEIPAGITALLKWSSERLVANGLSVASASVTGGLPGAPLCAVQPVEGQGFGVVLTQDVEGEVVLMTSPACMQMRSEESSVKHLLPNDGQPQLRKARGAVRGDATTALQHRVRAVVETDMSGRTIKCECHVAHDPLRLRACACV